MKLEPWANRKTAPIWVKEFHPHMPKLYYRTNKYNWVEEICRGERYAHIAPGLMFVHESYRGSYTGNWHGGPSGGLYDLMQWLKDAEHPEYEYTLWMELPEGEKVKYN